MNYIIFTDESGVWSSKSQYQNETYYVRSWVKVSMDFEKHLENIFRTKRYDVLVFHLTFTRLSEFYNRKFVVKREIIKAMHKIFFNLKSKK